MSSHLRLIKGGKNGEPVLVFRRGEPMPPHFERLVQLVADALHLVWQSQWALYDTCAAIEDTLTKNVQNPDHWIRAIMSSLNRSHQDFYRWASYSRLVPQEERAEDISPQVQMRMRRGKPK